jgi:hypothetical protein
MSGLLGIPSHVTCPLGLHIIIVVHHFLGHHPPFTTDTCLSNTVLECGRVLASSHLTTLSYYDILCRLAFRIRYCPRVLDLGDNVHAVNDVAEDDVLTVQMGRARLWGNDEELAAIGVGTGLCKYKFG